MQLAALLDVWFEAFGSGPTTIATVARRAETYPQLAMIVEEITGQQGRINTRSLGRWVERLAGRMVNGKCFTRVGLRTGIVNWRVSCAQPAP